MGQRLFGQRRQVLGMFQAQRLALTMRLQGLMQRPENYFKILQ
jgi:hypothetical protein